MGAVVLPAPVDGGGLGWEVRIVLRQRFPEKWGSLTRRLMCQQASCRVAAGKDKPVGTFAHRFPPQRIMLEGQWRMLVKLKVIQTPRQVITEVQGITIHTFADRTSRQIIPFARDFPPIDTFTGRQASGLVIFVFHHGIGIGGFYQLISFVVFVGGGVFKR
ncbi:hypothetical protein Xind_03971 [Xenorhabdus indica]|nr:hypothetical protein [Xenorhabdus indica]